MRIKLLVVPLLVATLTTAANADYKKMIKTEARRQGVDPLIAVAVATVESSLNPRATSLETKLYKRIGGSKIQSTALGLFQLVPHFQQKRCGAKHPLELMSPTRNIRCGIGYIRYCSDKHKSLKGAMKCYNGGSDYYYRVKKVLEG